MPDTRQKLISAATCMFRDQGFKATTLEAVADRAELDPAMARALFVDKTHLLQAVLEEITAPFLGAIAVALQDVDDPREFVRESLRRFDRFLFDHPDYVTMMQRCMADDPAQIAVIYDQTLHPSEFAERLEAFQQSGAIRGDLFHAMMIMDSLILFGHYVRPAVTQMQPDRSDEEIYEKRFEAIWSLLEGGLFA